MSDDSVIDFLGSVELFSAFSAEDLEELAEHAESQTYDFGDSVYNAGDPGDGLYVIKRERERERERERLDKLVEYSHFS